MTLRDGHDWAMAYNFVSPERDQLYLLPPSLSDSLEDDHLAWCVLDSVEEMDLSAFYADYPEDGWGGAAHHPKTRIALLVYACCLGVRRSRQIERACHVDVGFRVICAGLFPDHTTIARFRQRHEERSSDERRHRGLGRDEDGRQRLHVRQPHK
ncbi:MAG: transposase [Acidimicrobiales bacterium]